MGSRDAAHGWQGRQRIAVLLLALIAAACGGGDGSDETTAPVASTAETPAETAAASPSTLPPCSAARHLVAFDVFGTLSLRDEDAVGWIQDPTNEPDPRPGAADVATTYRSLGYEILYVTTVPVGVTVGTQPLDDALSGWFQRQGFPTGEGTSIYTVSSTGDAVLSIADALIDLEFGSDVSADAAYTDNEDKAYALVTGGIPTDRLFTLGSGAGSHGSTALPADDLVAHLPAVQALGKVCEPG